MRSLRHYGKHGLLNPRRTEGGYRDYDAGTERPVIRIRWLISAGFNMRQIRMLLPCISDEAPHTLVCSAARQEFKGEMLRIQNQMRALRKSERLLRSVLADRPAEGSAAGRSKAYSGKITV